MALAKLECLALAMALVNYVWLLILVSLTLLAGLLLVEAANLQMAARQEAEFNVLHYPARRGSRASTCRSAEEELGVFKRSSTRR